MYENRAGHITIIIVNELKKKCSIKPFEIQHIFRKTQIIRNVATQKQKLSAQFLVLQLISYYTMS